MNSLRYYFWYLFNLPLSYIFIDVTFPFVMTFVLTLLIEKAFDQVLPQHSMYLTVLGGILIFFIILILQHRLIERIFGSALKEFILSLRGKHPVTKKFGVRILKTFVAGNFNAHSFSNIYNLADLLDRVESRNGIDLSKGLYALLLAESAAFKPACLWATFDLAIFPMSEVFDSAGSVKSEFAFYFDTLSKIYSNIEKKENKLRIFLYDDVANLQTNKGHAGWQALKKFHKDWGFDNILLCSRSDFKGVQVRYPDAFMEDFVYFEINPFRNKWVIGMDSNSKIQSLIQRSLPVEDSRKLFIALQGKATIESL